MILTDPPIGTEGVSKGGASMTYGQGCNALLALLRGRSINFEDIDTYFRLGFTPEEAAMRYCKLNAEKNNHV